MLSWLHSLLPWQPCLCQFSIWCQVLPPFLNHFRGECEKQGVKAGYTLDGVPTHRRAHTLSFTHAITHYRQFRNANQPTMHVFGLGEETGAPRGNPQGTGRTGKLHGGGRNRTPDPGALFCANGVQFERLLSQSAEKNADLELITSTHLQTGTLNGRTQHHYCWRRPMEHRPEQSTGVHYCFRKEEEEKKEQRGFMSALQNPGTSAEGVCLAAWGKLESLQWE
ncbi:hypothetical protein QTP70_016104 [Hemibagrus guttatus]|uniref:Uncharacterized protein n=1 Tax=Hemibagrus guttatus TaxID=175788 RepID=A0AAE0UZE9_9TELE|nr:hypothetical protein QTP70_016104 [Hemibagrus guttatus]